MNKKKKQQTAPKFGFFRRHKRLSIALGVSFSRERAEEFGLDWKANYSALLNDMQLKHLRLMSYWSSHEAKRGQFDFNDLDWQVNEAAKHGAKLTLVLGLRQPR